MVEQRVAEPFDVIIRGGLFFDGRGGEGLAREVGIRGGTVRRVSAEPLSAGAETEVIDAEGCWVMPGFIDLHTHYDAELEAMPELFESVRHGVTTIIVGSCSLSLAVGKPVDLADMFCRTEAIPRPAVLSLLQNKDWDGPASYFEHLASMPLGPNVAAFLGHSAIRVAAMGMERSLTKGLRPTAQEMQRQEAYLEEALDAGYLGLSIETLPWDKMDGESFRSRPLPSCFSSWREFRQLHKILRRRGRVLEGVPNISTKINVLLFFLESIGILRKPLKTTIIALMDVKADRTAYRIVGHMARFANRFLNADMRVQALPEVFDLWADGIDLVVFEEFGAGMAALHQSTHEERARLLRDPAYRKQFKRQWYNRIFPKAFHRDFNHSTILECPDAALVGKSFAELGRERGQDAVDTFLDLVAEHGPRLRWYTIMGNERRGPLEWIVSRPDVLIGFSDAGAHLRQMAHYNFPLRMLRLVKDAQDRGEPFMTTGRAVERLTSEIALWLGFDAGVLAEGRRADVVVVDPKGLNAQLDEVAEEEMQGFGIRRLVRRNDSAVRAVLINGRLACQDGQKAKELGTERGYGQLLRAL